MVSSQPHVAVQPDKSVHALQPQNGVLDNTETLTAVAASGVQHHLDNVDDDSSSGSEIFEDTLDPDRLQTIVEHHETNKQQSLFTSSGSSHKEWDSTPHSREKECPQDATDTVGDQHDSSLRSQQHAEVMETLQQLRSTVAGISQQLETVQALVSSMTTQPQLRAGHNQVIPQQKAFLFMSGVGSIYSYQGSVCF